jgi:hypothetical protein
MNPRGDRQEATRIALSSAARLATHEPQNRVAGAGAASGSRRAWLESHRDAPIRRTGGTDHERGVAREAGADAAREPGVQSYEDTRPCRTGAETPLADDPAARAQPDDALAGATLA